jgi:hypothetical protein
MQTDTLARAVDTAHAAWTTATADAATREAELTAAELAHDPAIAATAAARAAFDESGTEADRAALKAAEDAERDSSMRLDRARRVLTKARETVEATHRAWLEAKLEAATAAVGRARSLESPHLEEARSKLKAAAVARYQAYLAYLQAERAIRSQLLDVADLSDQLGKPLATDAGQYAARHVQGLLGGLMREIEHELVVELGVSSEQDSRGFTDPTPRHALAFATR